MKFYIKPKIILNLLFSVLCSLESKSKSQLSQELAIEKRKNDILIKKLKEAKKLIKMYEQQAHHNTPGI